MDRATYNGHKKRNCMKFQGVSLPDGLIVNLYGPVEGRRHDMVLFRESGLENILEDNMVVGER